MKWRTQKKTKKVKVDRMGIAIGLHQESFDSNHLGSFQTITMDGLNAYFIRDGLSNEEYFGFGNYLNKYIIDLPQVSKKNLTNGRRDSCSGQSEAR